MRKPYYNKPERQEDLGALSKILQEIFRNKQVLEIACGTGYWTQRIGETAQSIVAIDINESVIEIAHSKKYEHPVSFRVKDVFKFNAKPCDALFGGFIWSHIKVEEMDRFIKKVDSLVKQGGLVVFVDNIYFEGSSTPLSHKDEKGNTYQLRKLEN